MVGTQARKASAEVDLDIQGMTCAACVSRVERALKKVPGVTEASVNLATHRAHVTGELGLGSDLLAAAVVKAGYQAQPVRDAMLREQESGPPVWELAVAILLTAPVVVASMADHHRSLATDLWIGILTTVVVFGFGRRFFVSAGRGLFHGGTTMDTLIALGAGAAWGLSAWALARDLPANGHTRHDLIYFETAATIVTLILLGKHLEARARRHTSDALRKLLDLAPKTVQRLEGGVWVDVELASVMPGDRLRARPGDRVAVDGLVVEGSSSLNESMLTGEPMPVAKGPGDPVFTGSLSVDGTVEYLAEKVGSATSLARIVALVERAQGSKAPAQRLADRVSAVFVPIVIGIAALTGLGWLLVGAGWGAALIHAVAVLVIACPCALGLATPTAIMVGAGRGMEMGTLFRDGGVLEKLGSVKTLFFDKTGTLTEGRPVVDTVWGHDPDEIILWAASAEQGSQHPIAAAILEQAAECQLDLLPATDFQAHHGRGVTALIQGVPVRVGTAEWLRYPERGASDMTRVLLEVNGSFIGSIDLEDAVRPEAVTALAELRALGVEPAILTGDAERPARQLAEKLGVKAVAARLLPEDKLRQIQNEQHGPVGMVGDGVNDAPALAAADVGIAMGRGSDVALETAGVALLRSDLTGVPQAIRLARATMRTIRANLFWAFAYNVVMIPLAVFGVLNPMFASAAMAFSSLTVVGNSLRLRRFSA